MKEKKLNVCLINDSFPPLIDGVANTVVNYASIINRELGKASVATPYYPDADDSCYDYPVIRMPSLDTTKLVGYRTGIAVDPLVMRKLEDSGFDIIHSHCPITSTMLARELRPNIDAPIVLTYHTKFDIDIKNSIKGELLQEGAIKALVNNVSACDEIWAVSRGAGENLKALGYRGDYIVMPNGVDFPKGRVSEQEIANACGDYDLPSDIPCYLFVGRIMWYKGLKLILDALKMLLECGKDFRMVFIGKGTDKEEVMAYSEKLGLSEKVFFVPPVYDRGLLRAWYCRADLFLFPSSFDTNGLVVREAAACALASVLVRGSCAAEDTSDKENCFWIEENAQSLYMLLLECGFDIPLLKSAGIRAMEQLYCSWEDSVKNAYERYGVVLDKYKSGECARERAKRQQPLDVAGEIIFDASAHTIQNLVNMGREKDRLIYGAFRDIERLKDDYEIARESMEEIRTNLREARNTMSLKQIEDHIRNQFDYVLKHRHDGK